VKVAYFDAFAGLSGDMTIGALLQLGVSLDAIRAELAKITLHGYELSQTERVVHGIRAAKFHVTVAETSSERSFRAISAMLHESALLPQVKNTALRIFTVLAEAEGRVHGINPEAVHFHEVGAVDAIVDIVGVAFGLYALGVDKVYASVLPLGTGLVPSRHGILPIPAPATVELLRDRPVRLEDGDMELVTPTGAAIVAAMAETGRVPELRMTSVGYGAGERTLSDRPNLLRILIGRPVVSLQTEQMMVLETNIDDLNPEFYEHVMECLFAAGARDVFLCPIYMKKTRPGLLLWVLGEEADRERLSALIFSETSTLGIRSYPVTRLVLRRESKEIATRYGTVGVKIAQRPDGGVSVAPEYEDCKRLAQECAVPLKTIYDAAIQGATGVILR
jgi:pyridinium-3,5-bisthiocarboxylic acid mononucleotide nickel chelatase